MDIKDAVDKALTHLTDQLENGSTEGYKLEAAREILKYSAITQ